MNSIRTEYICDAILCVCCASFLFNSNRGNNEEKKIELSIKDVCTILFKFSSTPHRIKKIRKYFYMLAFPAFPQHIIRNKIEYINLEESETNEKKKIKYPKRKHDTVCSIIIHSHSFIPCVYVCYIIGSTSFTYYIYMFIPLSKKIVVYANPYFSYSVFFFFFGCIYFCNIIYRRG